MSRKPWKNRIRFLQIFGECRLSQLHFETVVLAATSSLWVGCWFGGRAGEPTGWISGFQGVDLGQEMQWWKINDVSWSVFRVFWSFTFIYCHSIFLIIFAQYQPVALPSFDCMEFEIGLLVCFLYSFMLLWFLDSGAGGTQLVQRFSAYYHTVHGLLHMHGLVRIGHLPKSWNDLSAVDE